MEISIHAPAKGATNFVNYFYGMKVISIHAPAKGATLFIVYKIKVIKYFNPRSREGSDISVP